ncbi:MAG: DUF624 domain-containing protein [Clostridiales bacterium]|nr:DUF624 domain-containing protein [Clostridiales bacterium]
MRRIFGMDSPLMDALGKLSDLVFCNILFCLFCVPVFTIGASLTALYDCTLSIAEGTEDVFIPRQFWRAFRTGFKRSTLLWLVCLAAFALLGAYYLAVSSLTGPMARTYRVTFLALVLLFACGFQYLFPLQARFHMSVKEDLKNAWLLSAAALPCTLGTLAVPVAAFCLSFVMNPNVFYVAIFLWAIVVFAVVAYLNSFLFLRAFRKVAVSRS